MRIASALGPIRGSDGSARLFSKATPESVWRSTLVIPNTVTTISPYAFEYTKLAGLDLSDAS